MKKLALITSFLTIVCSSAAQDGVRTFASFERLKVVSNIKVELIKSNEEKAEIWIAHGELFDLELEQMGKGLYFEWANRPKPGEDRRAATIKLYYKELSSVSAHESAQIISNELINADHLEIDVLNGAAMRLQVNVKTLNTNVKYGGSLELSGTANDLVVKVASGSSFRGSNLEASQVKASARFGGLAKVWASDRIEATANGGSRVLYKGSPSVVLSTIPKWGGGSVRSM